MVSNHSLQDRYMLGHEFQKPVVLRTKTGYWKVLGTGLPYMGVKAPTWESAMNLANEAAHSLVRS